MSRRLIAPVLVLTAICVLVLPTAATASTTLFEAEGEVTVLTGTRDAAHRFTILSPDIAVDCYTETFSGTATDGMEEITMRPTYTGTPGVTPHTTHCNSDLGEATVDMNGCTYVLTGSTTGSDNGTDATVWIECPPEKEIDITTELEVTLHVHAQTPTSGGVTYANIEGGKVTVKATATGITYSCTPHFFCTLGGIATQGNNANYTGSTIVTGYEGKGGPANGDEFAEGKQVDIEVVSQSGDVLSTAAQDVSLVGEGTEAEEISLNAGVAECAESGYKGTLAVFPASELTLSFELAECKAFGFSNAEVQTNGCHYLFHEGEEAEGESFEGTADIECPEGKVIEVIAKVRGLLKCRATIGSQSGLSGVTYSGSGSGSSRDIEIAMHLEGVKYTQHTGEGLGKCTAGSFENGEIIGSPTVIGENAEKEQVGIWVQTTGPLPTLRSEIADTTLIGEDTGTEKIELEAGVAECTEAGYKGTISDTSQLTWTLAPEFANCDAFGFSAAEVKWNGCSYELAVSEAEASEGFEGVAEIKCAEGKAIEVIAESSGTLKCRATIGSQAGLTSLTLTNGGTGASRDFKMDLSLSGIAYTQHAGEGSGKCTAGAFTNGKFVGSPTVIGENAEKEQVGIWIG